MAGDGPPVHWALPQPSRREPDDGYTQLEGIEHFELFHATPERGAYCHHPHIAHHDGVFYAIWSNHACDEDAAGQRVLYSVSKDGRTWRPFAECFAPRSEVKSYGQTGRVLTANGLLILDDTACAIAEVDDRFAGRGGKEAREAAERRTGRKTRYGRFGYGRLVRSIQRDGTLSRPFWLVPDPPEPLGGRERFKASDDITVRDLAARINKRLADPLTMCAWDFRFHTNWTTAADGHVLCEPTAYRRPDGVVVKLGRDKGGSRRIYATVSSDGRTFAPAVRTRIPDSPSKAVSGTLPDGRIWLIGNQAIGRDPLVISLSRDGVTFEWAASIRHGAPKVRHPGRAKGRGFQYPSAVVVGDALWVIYSIGKEDVAVSRVPLSSLPK